MEFPSFQGENSPCNSLTRRALAQQVQQRELFGVEDGFFLFKLLLYRLLKGLEHLTG
jgi:hypothetical protein